MPENGHKSGFPSRDDIRDFMRTLRPDAPSMYRALDGVVSIGAVDKWYRDTEKGGNEVSATNLLLVVLALDKVPEFSAWLSSYASPVGETGHLDTPATAKQLQAADELIEGTKADLAAQKARAKQRRVSGGRKPR